MITTAQIHYAIPNSDGSQRYTYDNSFTQLPAGVTHGARMVHQNRLRLRCTTAGRCQSDHR